MSIINYPKRLEVLPGLTVNPLRQAEPHLRIHRSLDYSSPVHISLHSPAKMSTTTQVTNLEVPSFKRAECQADGGFELTPYHFPVRCD